MGHICKQNCLFQLIVVEKSPIWQSNSVYQLVYVYPHLPCETVRLWDSQNWHSRNRSSYLLYNLLVTLFLRIPNLRIHEFFPRKMPWFLLKEQESVFFVNINSVSTICNLNRKILPYFKRELEKFCEKKFRGFGIR